MANTPEARAKREAAALLRAALAPLPPATRKIVKELHFIRTTLTNQWRQSSFYAEQKQWFEANILTLKDLKIDQALSMGLGNLYHEKISGNLPNDAPLPEDHGRQGISTIMELVLFEGMLDVLRKNHIHSKFFLSTPRIRPNAH